MSSIVGSGARRHEVQSCQGSRGPSGSRQARLGAAMTWCSSSSTRAFQVLTAARLPDTNGPPRRPAYWFLVAFGYALAAVAVGVLTWWYL
jgi:hypothetical protein